MTEALLAQWKDRVLEAQTEISVVQDEINSVLQQRKALKQTIRRYEDTVAQEKRELLVQLEQVEAQAKDLSARCEATVRQKDQVEAIYVKTLDEYESMHYLVREIKDQEEQLAQREDLEAKLQRDSLAWAEEEHTLRTKLRRLQSERNEELQAQRKEIALLEAAVAEAEQKQQKARQEYQASQRQKKHGLKRSMDHSGQPRLSAVRPTTTNAREKNEERLSQARRSTTRATTAAPSLQNSNSNNNNSSGGRATMPSAVYHNAPANEDEENDGNMVQKMYYNTMSNRTYAGATRARSAYTLPSSSSNATYPPATAAAAKDDARNMSSLPPSSTLNAYSRVRSMPAVHEPMSDTGVHESERQFLASHDASASTTMRPLKSCLKNSSNNSNTNATTTNNNNNSNSNNNDETNNNSSNSNAYSYSYNTYNNNNNYGAADHMPLSAPVSRAGSQSLVGLPTSAGHAHYDSTLDNDAMQPQNVQGNTNTREEGEESEEVREFRRQAMRSGGMPTRAYSYNPGKRPSRRRDILGDSTNYQ